MPHADYKLLRGMKDVRIKYSTSEEDYNKERELIEMYTPKYNIEFVCKYKK